MPKRSAVWLHFDKSADGKSAKCKHCGKIEKSNLRSHFYSMHKKYTIEASQTGNEEPQPSKRQKLEDKDCCVSSQADAGPSTSKAVQSVSTRCSSSTSILKQPSIINTIKGIEFYKNGGRQNEKITQSIVYMICKDMQPFSIVERDGFKKLMKNLVPHYELPSRFTLKRQVQSKYDVVSSSMRKLLANKKVTLTTDVWTDLQMRSYSSLTVHFIDDENQLFSGTVGMVSLEDRHTAEYLCVQLRSLCSQWQIQEDNIVVIITDNGSHIVKAINIFLGAKRHIPCYAHTLNLVCQNSLKNCPGLVELLEKVKKIVSWFKQSVVASDELRNASPNKKVIQYINTVNARLRLLENETNDQTISDNETDSSVENSSKSIFSEYNKQIQTKWKQTNKEETHKDLYPELSLYLSAPAAKIEENPIAIWEDMKGTYPKLLGVVAEFVPLVGTSVPSERLFSKAGQIITKTRNRLEETDHVVLLGLAKPLKIGEITVNHSSVISTDETLYIMGQKINPQTIQELQMPNIIQMKLHPKHSLILEKLEIPRTHHRLEPIETTNLQPLMTTSISLILTLLIMSILALILYIEIRKRRRIYRLLFGPKMPQHQVAALQELLEIARTEFNPKEGGET
ncbi:unnamed protein product [Diabrotica balteata]|uniref:Uncharacterized protein n=1 Tax=Diabrotica balteata TaxID=107213 RepID=A0A9N9SNQ1_DIABA|nr:unnamed protein product [Diabrotica balteata]